MCEQIHCKAALVFTRKIGSVTTLHCKGIVRSWYMSEATAFCRLPVSLHGQQKHVIEADSVSQSSFSAAYMGTGWTSDNAEAQKMTTEPHSATDSVDRSTSVLAQLRGQL